MTGIGSLPAMRRPGVEPTACWSQVQHQDYYDTKILNVISQCNWKSTAVDWFYNQVGWYIIYNICSQSLLSFWLHFVICKKIFNEKKRSEEMQTLCTGCSKVEPKIFAPSQTPSRGRGMAKISAGDGHYLYLQTQFGEDRCTQFRVIVVTDPYTDRNNYNTLRRS